MIIVEGPDGAGKSTLVDELVGRLGVQIGARGVVDRDKLYTVTRSDTRTALGAGVMGVGPFVWDRLFYSEFVYADIVGRDVEFPSSEEQFTRRVIEAARFPVIVCMPPRTVVLENSEKKHQMAGVKEGLGTIYERYGSLLNEGFFPEHTIRYDYTGASRGMPDYYSLDEVVGECEDYLDERRARLA